MLKFQFYLYTFLYYSISKSAGNISRDKGFSILRIDFDCVHVIVLWQTLWQQSARDVSTQSRACIRWPLLKTVNVEGGKHYNSGESACCIFCDLDLQADWIFGRGLELCVHGAFVISTHTHARARTYTHTHTDAKLRRRTWLCFLSKHNSPK